MATRKIGKSSREKKANPKDHKRPSTLGLGRRPFRGRTPVGVFQIVEFGAGGAHSIVDLALKHRDKHFIAVDPIYKTSAGHPPVIPSSRRTMENFIDEMKRRKIVTRSIVIRAPNPYDMRQRTFRLDKLFEEAHNILLPNGKIYLTSEDPNVLDLAEFLANENGLKCRPRKRLLYPKSSVESQTMSLGHPIHMLEVTYGLKKAFPGKGREVKRKRFNWTRE